jgi:mono/diheme cytochrome c family protein
MHRLQLYLCLLLLTAISLAWSLRTIVVNAQSSPSPETARGHYLAEEVARCAECHTLNDEPGNLEGQARLQGRISNGAAQAPPLTDLRNFSDKQMENLLEKGVGRNGEALRPPMHTHHFDPADARAIIGYLKSLPRGGR